MWRAPFRSPLRMTGLRVGAVIGQTAGVVKYRSPHATTTSREIRPNLSPVHRPSGPSMYSVVVRGFTATSRQADRSVELAKGLGLQFTSSRSRILPPQYVPCLSVASSSRRCRGRPTCRTGRDRPEAEAHLRNEGRGNTLRTYRGVNFCKFRWWPQRDVIELARFKCAIS